MYDYKFFDYRLTSEFLLPLAVYDLPHEAANVYISLGTQSRRPQLTGLRPLPGWVSGIDDIGIAALRSAESFIVSAPSGEIFEIADVGNRIQAWYGNTGSLLDLSHFLLGLVLPLAASLRGENVFHSAGVSVGDRTILLIGNSGAGKSTLGAYLSRRGFSLLSDDCMLVRKTSSGYVTVPSFKSLRLWVDSIKGVGITNQATSPVLERCAKQQIHFENPQVFDVPPSTHLSGIYILNAIEEVNENSICEGITRATVTTGLKQMLESQMWLDTDNEARMRKNFHFLTGLMSEVPVSRLTYRRKFESLDRVFDCFVSDGMVPETYLLNPEPA